MQSVILPIVKEVAQNPAVLASHYIDSYGTLAKRLVYSYTVKLAWL